MNDSTRAAELHQVEALLKTKLYLPESTPSHLTRSRLNQLLERALGARLTTVVAPPGFGKSTLVSSWIRQSGLKNGWLSLDSKENDPLRFWRYLRGSVEQALHIKLNGESGLGGFESAERLSAQLLHALIESSQQEEPLMLVLDDYHMIETDSIHEALYDWLCKLPASVHLILISRHEIPIPLGAMRANGRLNEISLSNLRFTDSEIDSYWHLQTGASPDSKTFRHLVHHTEGWAAMLQLSALSYAAGQISGVIKPLTGRNRHVADYLMEEVFSHISEETKRFMRKTSILDRLCPSLCSAVINEPDAGDSIQELVRRGLFLIPLDDEREWYRYHHLFADFLRVKLRKEEQAGMALLHSRAAEWYKSHGYLEEAIEQALFAGDERRAAAWMQQHAHIWLKVRETVLLRRWLDQLSIHTLNETGNLLLLLWIDLMDGHTEMAEVLLRKLNTALASMKADPQASGFFRMREEVRIIENFHAVLSGNFDHALALIQEYGGREDLPDPETPLLLSLGLELNEGTVPFIRGKFGFNGRIEYAESYHRAYGEFIEKNGLHESAYTSYQQIAMGEVCYLRNHLPLARSYAEEGIRLGRKFGTIGSYVPSVLLLSHILIAEQRSDEALDVMEEAMSHLRSHHQHTSVWYSKLAASIVIRQLQLGNSIPAREWADEYKRKAAERTTSRDDLFPDDEDFIYIQILMGVGKWEEACESAINALSIAQLHGNGLSELQGLLLLSEIYANRNNSIACRRLLLSAVRVGCYDGNIRSFLDSGPAVMERLGKYKAASSNSSLWSEKELSFIHMVCRQSENSETGNNQVFTNSVQSNIDVLTAREMEVFILMAQGLSNKAIAAELVLTEGTVKLHLHRVYSKLQAQGRVQAIRIAENSGLLEKL
ncbi:LuxR family maltose regulon positive regulatory protein [Paenibacillus endophyticus]|uniref:LuxR family maltose regulon positive regulatory protein n=1 Tax=Paenibacillus endophyticus TaxID=1294268 RepID=A0A7W5GCD1_9BACL|nr:LuxR C-terminal-related transcriptional regulator [Paenibacillus endophyticus]MBB3154721.1 LuxR family maltose regulon positive regulatory protein [Paenibacillus endophyticus]